MAAFVSGYLTQLFDIHLGYTFSASLIDYGLGFFNQKNSFWLFAVVGPSIALLYFSVFYVTIPLFNFKTPGRETDKEEAPQATPIRGVAKDRAAKILVALGGAENILELEACITRLRLRLKDVAKIQGDTLKKLGASGLFNPGSGNVQVVFGVESDMIKEEIKALMAKPAHIVRSPLQGKLMSLSEVPDPTFSGEVLGPGFAILPTAGHMESPVNGVVQFVAPTLHAVGLLADNGAELLIHVGIDTVKLNGEGFKSFVKVGDTVTLGQRLLEFDLDLIEKNGKSTLTPVVLLNNQQFTMKEKATANSRLAFGEAVMTLNEMST
jgi:PTS system glucose-specific IIC component